MKNSDFEKLKEVLAKILENNKFNEDENVSQRIKETMKRIIVEIKSCLVYENDEEYLVIQQFRILMDKIINVMLLRDQGIVYMDYLECCKEAELLNAGRKYLSRKKMNDKEISDRKKFIKKKWNKDLMEGMDSIRKQKYHDFYYRFGYVSNDSSRAIHDDNSTYDNPIDERTIKEIEEIILFFISNIFIYFCKNDEDKKYLRSIHKVNAKKIKNNSSISINKKNIQEMKAELRCERMI